jgi:hypothetical protein
VGNSDLLINVDLAGMKLLKKLLDRRERRTGSSPSPESGAEVVVLSHELRDSVGALNVPWTFLRIKRR